jgi:hypothetical protein
MDLGFGGPVWHASIRVRGNAPVGLARRLAHAALEGVGDSSLGEWGEQGESAYHVRRRLSVPEQIQARLAMRDIRGTDEARERVNALLLHVPQLHAFAVGEAGL